MATVDVATTTVSWRDARGYVCQQRYYVNFSDASDRYNHAFNIFSTLASLSNAHLDRTLGAYNTVPAHDAYGTALEYLSVSDKAAFIFDTQTGGRFQALVPAPKAALFLADGVTIDPSNAAVEAFTGAMVAERGCTRGGDLLHAYLSGRLLRTSRPRRFGTWQLAPDLIKPGW